MNAIRALAMLLAALALAACGGDDNSSSSGPPPSPYANYQLVNASPDAAPLALFVDGTAASPYLDFGQGTGEQSFSVSTHSITVQAETPGTPTTVIGPLSVAAAQNMDYVVVATGPVASIAAVVFPHTLETIGSTTTRVQVVHAAPTAPALSVFITTPGADLASSAPFGSASFKGAIGPTNVTSGEYEIRITPSGATSPVLYDSGTIVFTGSTDLVVPVLPNLGPGTATFTLAAIDAFGDSTWLPDASTPAAVRMIHDSPDAPALSLISNGNTASPLVPTLAYAASTPYLSLTPGAYTLAFTPAGNTGDILASASGQLTGGTYHSVYAFGTLAEIGFFVTRDHNRRIATQAQLRIIHGAPSAGALDVYLTAPGAAIASASPSVLAIPFATDTGFVSYAAGSYDLTFTLTGTKTVVLGPVAVTLNDSGIYTAVARDAPGGGSPLGLIELDDL